MMAVIKILISSVCALFILCSCEHRLDDALELAGDNKGELEIEFYNSRNQKLTGKIIGAQGTDKQTKESVFDSDVLTGFNGVSPDGHWVGLHLSRPSDVSKIRYMPRNDGNCVEVGDMYHLLMYDKGRWVYLALMRAETTKLVINNVPSEGLYILKDISKGKEERVFTYENGKQVWW